MNKITKISAISVTAAILGLSSLAAVASRGEDRGSCEYSERQGHHSTMKYSGKGGYMDRELDLSAEEVKTLIEAKLIMRGDDRLKVGKVTQKDDETYVVDVVTVDDSLVRQIEIDKDKGFGRNGYAYSK